MAWAVEHLRFAEEMAEKNAKLSLMYFHCQYETFYHGSHLAEKALVRWLGARQGTERQR